MEKISIAQVAAFPPKLSFSQSDAADMLLNREDMGLPTDQELDRLLECRDLPENLYDQGFGFEESFNWFRNVLSGLNWWVRLANLAFENPKFDDDGKWTQRPGFEDRRRELSQLLANVLAAYPAASEEVALHWMDDSPENALVELMRRYRLYTRRVEALVFEVWPEINRDLLTKPELLKGRMAGAGEPYVEFII